MKEHFVMQRLKKATEVGIKLTASLLKKLRISEKGTYFFLPRTKTINSLILPKRGSYIYVSMNHRVDREEKLDS